MAQAKFMGYTVWCMHFAVHFTGCSVPLSDINFSIPGPGASHSHRFLAKLSNLKYYFFILMMIMITNVILHLLLQVRVLKQKIAILEGDTSCKQTQMISTGSETSL